VFGFGILLDYKGPGPNYIFIWLSIAAVVLMPLSRMYLGAHSLNQVLEGVLLGLAMCLLYFFKLK
jgi:membrane-associated phospholipid phosphatase